MIKMIIGTGEKVMFELGLFVDHIIKLLIEGALSDF